ncbi:uncharacterized protein DFL_002379 [Arthrobotrys flagrans]|uniref:MARVEL domain-containing protein n=1 Tax=Arthrobotrys flagrans TaxID=97331 RepID=A0A437AAB7_ARTFL|nr:hypothetical protein DFL_002379 [Arthrobotrys flagrans]
MRRRTNGYAGGDDNIPTFRVRGRWLAIRYLQSFCCLFVLPFFTITANSRSSRAGYAPKFIHLPGGWGYIIVLACLSFYVLLSGASVFFICFNVILSPIEGFGIDVFIFALWAASLTGTIVAQINFSKAIAEAQSRRITTSTKSRVGLWMTFICLAICITTSIYTTYLSYLQLAEHRRKLHQRRSLESTVALVPSPSSPVATTTPSTPQTAARPVSVASSVWSRIRPISSSSNSIPTRQRDEEEEEPKPEETTGLTREQIIAERIEAARAPPTYWYATSSQSRGSVAHDPEAGDETLPLYRP